MSADKVLEGRLALVTGASRGIGRASAIALAKAGAHVICVARTTGGLEETDDEIQKAGGTATLVPMNLRDFDAIDRLGASIFERWGKLAKSAAIAGAKANRRKEAAVIAMRTVSSPCLRPMRWPQPPGIVLADGRDQPAAVLHWTKLGTTGLNRF